MERDYCRLMERISVPPEVNERVLQAAKETDRRRKSPVGWLAACAVLVLLIAGSVLLQPMQLPAGEVYSGNEVQTAELTAYAAALGVNGGVLLEGIEGQALSTLEGTTRTLSLVFENGQEITGMYSLRKERLTTSVGEDGEAKLVPVLTGDPAETVEGIYAVSAEESRWLLWPVAGSSTVSLSNRYGYRVGPGGQRGAFHSGIDIPAESGTAVTAAASGTVIAAEFDTERGNYVVLDHGEGLETVYAHCLSLAVETGEAVEAGQVIATVGSTGKSTGPHLCFQVWRNGRAENPVAYFPAAIRDTLQAR